MTVDINIQKNYYADISYSVDVSQKFSATFAKFPVITKEKSGSSKKYLRYVFRDSAITLTFTK